MFFADVLDILGPNGRQHFFEAIEKGEVNIARVNLDMVGDGEAGKSSLGDSLMDELFIEGRESTKGASVIYMVRTAIGSINDWKKDNDRCRSLGCLLAGGSVVAHDTVNTPAESKANLLQTQSLPDNKRGKGDTCTPSVTVEDVESSFSTPIGESSQVSDAEGGKENISMPTATVKDLKSRSTRQGSNQVSSADLGAEDGKQGTSTSFVEGEDVKSSSSVLLKEESSQVYGTDKQVLNFQKAFQTAKDLTEEQAKEIKSLRKDPEKLQKQKNLVYISVCDRGGQQHFLPIHTALIANCSEFIPKVYLLVFDLTKRLGDVATATYRAKRGGERIAITPCRQMKNKEIVGHWATAVDLAHPESEMQPGKFQHVQRKFKPYLGHPEVRRGPPMFIIGTHYDEIVKKGDEGKEFVRKQEEAVSDILSRCKYTERVVSVKGKKDMIFKVDNTRSGTGSPDPMVNSLKKQIIEMAMAYREAMKATPLPYVVLELGLLNVSQPEGPDSACDSDRKILYMKDIVHLAKQYCNIEDEDRLKTALKYLSSVGAIFYFYKVTSLIDKVFPDPQWLFDVMSTFVTILGKDDVAHDYGYDLRQLKGTGRLSRQLAIHLLERRQELGVKPRHYNTIFCLLHLVDIFCPAISHQSSEKLAVDDVEDFYVPCMLDNRYNKQSEWELSSVSDTVSGSSDSACQIPSLVFKPDNVDSFPESLFFRLSSRTAYEFPEFPELKRNRIQVCFDDSCLKLELLYHSSGRYVIATVYPGDKEEPPSPEVVNKQCTHVRRFLCWQLNDAKKNGVNGFQYKVYFQHGKKQGTNDVDEESLYHLPDCDEMPKTIINPITTDRLYEKDILSLCIKYWYSSEHPERGKHCIATLGCLDYLFVGSL